MKQRAIWFALSCGLLLGVMFGLTTAEAQHGLIIEVAGSSDPASDMQGLYTQAVRLIEAGRLDEAVTAAHETVDVARQAAAASGADVNAIVSLLLALHANLSVAGRHPEAGEVAQAVANVLRGFAPPPAGQAAHLWLLENALYDWAVQLIAAERLDEAVTTARETVDVARQAAAASGADVNAIVSLLLALHANLSVAGRHPEAAEVAQAAANVLRGFAPPPAGQAAHLWLLENALYDWAMQLIAAERLDEAVRRLARPSMSRGKRQRPVALT